MMIENGKSTALTLVVVSLREAYSLQDSSLIPRFPLRMRLPNDVIQLCTR